MIKLEDAVLGMIVRDTVKPEWKIREIIEITMSSIIVYYPNSIGMSSSNKRAIYAIEGTRKDLELISLPSYSELKSFLDQLELID